MWKLTCSLTVPTLTSGWEDLIDSSWAQCLLLASRQKGQGHQHCCWKPMHMYCLGECFQKKRGVLTGCADRHLRDISRCQIFRLNGLKYSIWVWGLLTSFFFSRQDHPVLNQPLRCMESRVFGIVRGAVSLKPSSNSSAWQALVCCCCC